RRVSFGVLNGVPGFMRGNAERCDRGRVEYVAREAKPLARRIVMIAEEIVCLDNIDIVNLRRLQDLPRALRAGNVGAGPHLAPFSKRASHPELRPKSNDHRDPDVEQPIMPEKKSATARVKHVDLNLVHQNDLS